MLKIRNLHFSFKNKKIINNLSLDLHRGECIALLGPSGTGKTTLFNLIAGLLPYKEGVIEIEGGDSQLTYMMQEDLLLPWRTALGNLLLIAEFQKERRRDEALALLDEVGLKGFEHHYPRELSGGMRQRVSLARALMQKRPLMILDEPFGSIDRLRRLELYELIKKLQKRYRLTILFITHDPLDAEKLADRIYEMHEGRVHEGVACS